MSRLRLLVFIGWLLLPSALFAAPADDPNLQLLQPGQGQTQTATESEIKDILGPVELPAPPDYLTYAVIAVLVVAVILLTFLLLKKNRRPAPSPPPHAAALENLAGLEKTMDSVSPLVFVEQLIGTLRDYVRDRFHLNTGSKTSREFLQDLVTGARQGVTLINRHENDLKHCLSVCDMAKFAHRLPEREAMEEMLATVRTFVESTRLEPQPGEDK
ncbi:MAG: hypothetical protein ABFS19_04840 [Thermodesulfobacteriota bacterium]